jgi:hypothetical protein
VRAGLAGKLSTAGRTAPAKARRPIAVAAAVSSIVTTGSPGRVGPPCTTAGNPLAVTASRTGSPSLVVQTMKPSTTASLTRCGSLAAPVTGTRVRPTPSAAHASATPARNLAACGSSKA